MSDVDARCSFCHAYCTHKLITHSSFFRNVYICTVCDRKGVPCIEKCGAMAECGDLWDSLKCAKCSGDIPGWPRSGNQPSTVPPPPVAAPLVQPQQRPPGPPAQANNSNQCNQRFAMNYYGSCGGYRPRQFSQTQAAQKLVFPNGREGSTLAIQPSTPEEMELFISNGLEQAITLLDSLQNRAHGVTMTQLASQCRTNAILLPQILAKIEKLSHVGNEQKERLLASCLYANDTTHQAVEAYDQYVLEEQRQQRQFQQQQQQQPSQQQQSPTFVSTDNMETIAKQLWSQGHKLGAVALWIEAAEAMKAAGKPDDAFTKLCGVFKLCVSVEEHGTPLTNVVEKMIVAARESDKDQLLMEIFQDTCKDKPVLHAVVTTTAAKYGISLPQ